MYNEIQHERDQENAALGEALMHAIADCYGCECTEAAIKRAIYKGTNCGAWIEFTEKGVKVGSIVEGHDCDTQSYNISYNGNDEAFLIDLSDSLECVETEADEMWRDVNGE